VVVALALRVAGVRPDAIAADYAATGDRTGPLLARLRRSVTYSADVNRKPDDAHKPQAGTMTAFLAELDARFGGPAAWLTAHGMGEEDLTRLRDKLRTALTGPAGLEWADGPRAPAAERSDRLRRPAAARYRPDHRRQ
jgi:hypothetical protein